MKNIALMISLGLLAAVALVVIKNNDTKKEVVYVKPNLEEELKPSYDITTVTANGSERVDVLTMYSAKSMKPSWDSLTKEEKEKKINDGTYKEHMLQPTSIAFYHQCVSKRNNGIFIKDGESKTESSLEKMQIKPQSRDKAMNFTATETLEDGSLMLAGDDARNFFKKLNLEPVTIRANGETALFDFTKFKEVYKSLCSSK